MGAGRDGSAWWHSGWTRRIGCRCSRGEPVLQLHEPGTHQGRVVDHTGRRSGGNGVDRAGSSRRGVLRCRGRNSNRVAQRSRARHPPTGFVLRGVGAPRRRYPDRDGHRRLGHGAARPVETRVQVASADRAVRRLQTAHRDGGAPRAPRTVCSTSWSTPAGNPHPSCRGSGPSRGGGTSRSSPGTRRSCWSPGTARPAPRRRGDHRWVPPQGRSDLGSGRRLQSCSDGTGHESTFA